MGLTHYWRRKTKLPARAFARAAQDFKTACQALDVSLAGCDGTGEPLILPDAIIFNGVGQAGMEPFAIHQVEFDRHGRDVVWSFCKTGGAPYDLAVQVALIILKHHLGNHLVVTSDVGESQWNTARALCRQSLGYGSEFCLAHDGANPG